MHSNLLSNFNQIDFLTLSPNLLYTGRRDTKYIIHNNDWLEIIGVLENDYSVVMHQGNLSQTYSTVYYDTTNLKFYLQHHNGYGNRVKMRTRTYSDGNSFFEVKQKTNKGLTVKERFEQPTEHVNGLIPQLEVVYDRVTMYDMNFEEKLTFDFNLKFRNDKFQIGFASIVIAESKKMKGSNSVFVNTTKSKKINSSSFSKYCVGIASLHPLVKQNNFKTLLQKINKLNNKYESASDC